MTYCYEEQGYRAKAGYGTVHLLLAMEPVMKTTAAHKAIDARREEALAKLSPGTAATLARAYDRARAQGREVVYQYEEELHARCLSTNERAEQLRAALRARGVIVLDDAE